ncbi:MAG: hypothetical protein J2P55_00120 [Rhizobiales bacterium]|nr:hypothetical protein [Hyphomicrobiales bacterium]
MNAIEEGGKVASGVVTVLKDQPLALALIVMNVIFVGIGTYIYFDMITRFANVFKFVTEHCLKQ